MRAAYIIVALLMVVLVTAQTNSTQMNIPQGQVPEQVQPIVNAAKNVFAGLRLLLAAAFWGALGIIAFHAALAYLAPTRYQRLGAMWDLFERSKDIAIGAAIFMLAIYAVFAVLYALSNQSFGIGDAMGLFYQLFVQPITSGQW